MKKKVVFLLYDADTAIGITNEGTLAFSYNLEDIDKTASGADIFNGQQSVLWKNMRAAFFDEMKVMYQNLRSSGALSYEKVERMYEEHQAKWPEAIFNEDAWFKYLAPLVEKGNASYLSMLQGSKAEQRKWWLYNRFRYIDSKYNAGDALTDVITVRGYAKSDITVEPYADVYASVKYGSYLVQARSARNSRTTLPCPLDNVNDTEIMIFSASQLADVGDLSGLMVGYADFSKATKLQALKLGDEDASYSNGNLTELYLGNNELLRTLDVRNCPALTQAVDISGCSNIEHIYFDGTSITGLDLPVGGIIKTLHLPATLANLTVIGHNGITDFALPSVSNLTTCRLENVGTGIDTKALINDLPAGCRVRMISFDWRVQDEEELTALKACFDTMRGLNESGGNEDKAQLMGTIHIITVTGATLKLIKDSYPDITVLYSNITSHCYYWNYDGTKLLYTATAINSSNVNYGGSTPSRPSDAQYTYTFAGWSRTIGGARDPDAQSKVVEDRNLYAIFTSSIRTYTVRFYVGSKVIQTISDVPYGGSAYYTGETPTNIAETNPEDYEFVGWDKQAINITGNTNCYAQFQYTGMGYKRLLDGGVAGPLENSDATVLGGYALSYFENATTISLPNVTTVGTHAFFFDSYGSKTTHISLPKATSIGESAFASQRVLETVDLPLVETLGKYAFQNCSKLTTLSLPKVKTLSDYCLYGCTVLESLSLPIVEIIGTQAVNNARALKSIDLPATLTRIGQSAFGSCSALEEVTIPAAVTTIQQNAFSSCTSLKRVIFLGIPSTVYNSAFKDCTALEDIYVPWEYGQVGNSPWGATNATIHYVDEGWQEEILDPTST